MPCIQLKTTVPLTPELETRLKDAFGKSIALLPGKSEQWLMVSLEGGCRLYFGGTDARPSALAEVKLFGRADDAAYDQLTASLTDTLHRQLGVSPDRIYVKYEETSHWGWNGHNF